MNIFSIINILIAAYFVGPLQKLLMLFFILVIYFIPSIIAFRKKKNNVIAIGALNLFLGWTIIGWVGALVWSLSSDQETDRVNILDDAESRKEDDIDKIERLKKLLDQQAITQTEFDKKKGEILNGNND